MTNARAFGESDWLHHAVTEWTEMGSGETRTMRAPIGGYLLVRSGEVQLRSGHGDRTLHGPTKSAVGGGSVTIEALSDAEVAFGSIRTHVGVVIDVEGGYQSDLWDILGRNGGKRPRAHYLNR